MRRTPLDAWIAHKIGRAGQVITRADVVEYQLAKLGDTLRLVREQSRFYRKHLADVPRDLTSLADLTRLPFTTADDIRSNPQQFVCGSQDAIRRVVTLESSGTTGRPKRIYFTRDDQELTVDFFRAGMSTFTDPGDRVLILLPGETPGSVGDLLAAALERLGAVPVKHGPVRDAAATLDVIRRSRINGIVGVPTHALALARPPDQPGQPMPRLKSALLSTDHVPDAIRRALESAFGCAVYNHYGMTEMGLGGGVECEARRGYHLREADMLFEVVDPVTGLPLPDGEYGEVVFTTLTRRGMPLIRYRTGDVSRFIPASCPCGTSLKLLETIRYRLDGRVPVGAGFLTMADLDEALFAVEGVLDFRASVEDERGRDCLTLQIRWVDHEDADAALDALHAAVPLARQMAVRIQSVDAFAASMAKRAIADARGKSE